MRTTLTLALPLIAHMSAFGASLFFVTGEATPKEMTKVPVTLYRLDAGRVTAVRQISDGADFIHESVEDRLIVVGAHAEDRIPARLDLVDFDAPEAKLKILVPETFRNRTRSLSHILNVPGIGPVYGFKGLYTSSTPTHFTHENVQQYRPGPLITEWFGVRLDDLRAGRPAQIEILPASWFAHAHMDGVSGEFWNLDTDEVVINRSTGTLSMPYHGVPIDLPPVPVSERFEGTARVLIDGMNRQVMVLVTGWAEQTGVEVWDVRSHGWRRVSPPLPGKHFFLAKTIGEWISMAPMDAVPEEERAAAKRDLEQRIREARALGADDAVKSDPKATAPGYRRRVGGTYLYNALTQTMFVLVNDTQDAELLLVDGKEVYFRSEDRILRSQILADRLGPPELIVEGEEFRSVHWAFFGPSK